jgi:hypothetical protein
MVFTSELYERIRDGICLSPSADYYLRDILRSLDGQWITDDLAPKEEDEEE